LVATSRTLRPAAGFLHRWQSGTLVERAIFAALSTYQLLAAAVFVAGLALAITWMREPFIGALVDAGLRLTRAAPTGAAESWSLVGMGAQPGETVAGLDGTPTRTTLDLRTALDSHLPGDQVMVQIQARDGSESALRAQLSRFPGQDVVSYVVVPFGMSLALLALGIWTFVFRAQASSAGSAVVLFSSASIGFATIFDALSTHLLAGVWTFALTLAVGALLDSALGFLTESRGHRARVPLRWAIYLLPMLVGALGGFSATPGARMAYGFAGISFIIVVLLGVYLSISRVSPVAGAQGRTILLGTLLPIAPLAAWNFAAPHNSMTFTPYWLLPIGILPIAVGYSTLRRRLLPTGRLLRQGATYIALSIIVVGAYGLIVTGISIVAGSALPANSPWWIAALVFILAVALNPVRSRIQSFLDRTFFASQQARSQLVERFAQQLAGAMDLPAFYRLVRSTVAAAMGPQAIHVFAFDEVNDQYAALPDETGRPTTDLRFSGSGPLAQHFAEEGIPLHLGTSVAPELRPEQSRLTLLGARLIVGMPGRVRPIGWIALGPREDGATYGPDDLSLLEQFAGHASTAVRRAQTISNLERRVHEMNALTRVSQGVNITLTFDDVLELIYAQTSQIIPLTNFYITLFDVTQDRFRLGFVVEHNDRLPGRENQVLPPDQGLAPLVVRRGRPILTQDYGRECLAQGRQPIAEGMGPWMGVPLNAGAEAIGSLSVGSVGSGISYTAGQLELLQSIADQTAGAIVKARLLRETEQRAAQLAKLNEVTRQLTSTLELEPLLQSIVDGAAAILNSEAGAIYLSADSGPALAIRAVSGSFGHDAVGRSISVGAGVAEQAVASRAPVIDNEVHETDLTDAKQAGEAGPGETLSAMAAPLLIQDRNIGVLEVRNRAGGVPFSEEDSALLAAFAGQAAVAIENVRLYTLTDQELTSRVEELSVMQRIDRELNASLDMERAMRTTLEWALRQSTAAAGMIGMLEESSLRVIVEIGYEDTLAAEKQRTVSLAAPGLQEAVETGTPQQIDFNVVGGAGLLPGASIREVIPIRREASVIGLLVLESTGGAHEDLGFLSRLSDHAAIAISNAQLYEEVQRANIAKSDFVSLVAHELKNPMTSIKGYTELLAAGAVGPVTEMQTSFLSTIRSNTERMSTLVSDLNDNSKIEAGRLRLEFKSVEIDELVDEIVRSTKRQVEDKQQSIKLELGEAMPKIWGDRTRLAQVLTNLVSNAHKYTPEAGEMVIGAEDSVNHWDPEGPGRVVHFWVRDNGIGIAPEDQQRIFQKFFRSEDPKAREVPGAGLGLNITRSLVEMQGGRIWFESQYRQGTTFHFTVPVAEG
jgi:signal transduction histidine kinase